MTGCYVAPYPYPYPYYGGYAGADVAVSIGRGWGGYGHHHHHGHYGGFRYGGGIRGTHGGIGKRAPALKKL
jgi:hypothetical protein